MSNHRVLHLFVGGIALGFVAIFTLASFKMTLQTPSKASYGEEQMNSAALSPDQKCLQVLAVCAQTCNDKYAGKKKEYDACNAACSKKADECVAKK